MQSDLLLFFVSHVFEHDADRRAFHEHLQKAWPRDGIYRILEPSLRHHDESLSSKEIQAHLRQRISTADVVLVAAALYALKSKWMSYEIRTARRLEKPIILVRRPRVRCPKRLVELCGVQPTELDTLRWKITRLLPAERLSLLRAKEIEQALGSGSQPQAMSANAKHNQERYPWLSKLRPIADEWPKVG